MNDENYQRERKFFVLYDRLVMTPMLGFESSAIAALEAFEKESIAKAKKSLSITINDMLEMTESPDLFNRPRFGHF